MDQAKFVFAAFAGLGIMAAGVGYGSSFVKTPQKIRIECYQSMPNATTEDKERLCGKAP